MNIFISKTSNVLNKKELPIHNISKYLCISPYYKRVTVNKNNIILLDSGAFQDTKKENRLSFENAVKRQFDTEIIIKKKSDYIVSYDFIDNYEITLEANKFLLQQNLSTRVPIIMTQGLDLDEYIFCLNENIDIITNKNIILGLGGISKAGNNNKMKEKIFESIKYINKNNVKNIHLFGVGNIKLLKNIKNLLNKTCNITCDSSTYEIQSVMGKILNEEGKFIKCFSKEDKYINYHPCDLTIENTKKAIKLIREI